MPPGKEAIRNRPFRINLGLALALTTVRPTHFIEGVATKHRMIWRQGNRRMPRGRERRVMRIDKG